MTRLTTDRAAVSPKWKPDEREKLNAVLIAELGALGAQEVGFRQEDCGGGESKIKRSQAAQRQVAQLINLLSPGTPAILDASRQRFSDFLS
jgi:hypothetical protein